jgi:hypothetical protein
MKGIFKKENFEDELARSMQDQLSVVSRKIKLGSDRLSGAIDRIAEAIKIFEDTGFKKQAKELDLFLTKLAQEGAEIKPYSPWDDLTEEEMSFYNSLSGEQKRKLKGLVGGAGDAEEDYKDFIDFIKEFHEMHKIPKELKMQSIVPPRMTEVAEVPGSDVIEMESLLSADDEQEFSKKKA